MMATTFWHPDGTPMSARQFMEMLFGKLPEFFNSEDELRAAVKGQTPGPLRFHGSFPFTTSAPPERVQPVDPASKPPLAGG